uniref:Protein kinase domain-containing protein n=1 Tax=Acrobeloides nanus TaxID=290746 RepID=A0A914DJM3_9BILA
MDDSASHPGHAMTSYSYCDIGTCNNWTFVILLVLSTNFPYEQFQDVRTYVHSAIKSCTNNSGQMVTTYTGLAGNETHMWIRTHEDYDKYFNETFNWDEFNVPKLPTITQLVQALQRSINLTMSSPLPVSESNGRYILFITDFELYLNAMLADNIRTNLEEKHIRLRILEFDIKKNSSSSSSSDENYFEMIAEHGQIVEVSSTDSLKIPKILQKTFPCQGNMLIIGDDDALNPSSDDKLPRKSRPLIWPYILMGCILLASMIIIVFVCIWYRMKYSQNPKFFATPFENAIGSNYYSHFRDKNWLIPPHKLQIDYSAKLGSGAFCLVYKGTLSGKAPICRIQSKLSDSRNYRDCQVAVKMLPPIADPSSSEDFLQEVNLMKTIVYHPHLLRMLGVCEKPGLCLILEFCKNGDLLNFIRKNKDAIMKGDFKYTTLIGFAWQISDGMYFLASKNIIHRDLAARNIFIDENLTAKIGDFGLCRMTDSTIYMTRGGRLPIKWMALESLKHYEFTTKSDVWSYGVILYEIFSLGGVPYPEIESQYIIEYLESGKRITPPEFAIDEIAKAMQKCWSAKPDARPDFGEIRLEISKLLEVATENYGYFKFMEERAESQI